MAKHVVKRGNRTFAGAFGELRSAYLAGISGFARLRPFTSSSPKTYQIAMASYDRSGRLGMETFAVEPRTGWDDPLKLYYSAWGGWIGGGQRGIDELKSEPIVIRRELNEWVRFTTITDLLEQGVALEDVQRLAGHADPRTTRLYDRRQRKITRNIVERISV